MLDKKSNKLLKKLYRVEFLTFKDVAKITGQMDESKRDLICEKLFKENFAKNHYNGVFTEYGNEEIDGINITLDGEAYLQERFRRNVYFWVPYSITTLVAVASLIGTIAQNWETIQLWISA